MIVRVTRSQHFLRGLLKCHNEDLSVQSGHLGPLHPALALNTLYSLIS